AFWTGTARPFAHRRPGIVRRFADSARANALFSTAIHPPYVLARGFVAVVGSAAGFTSAGFVLWAANMTFELGNKIPLITWRRLAWTWAADPGSFCGAGWGCWVVHAQVNMSKILTGISKT